MGNKLLIIIVSVLAAIIDLIVVFAAVREDAGFKGEGVLNGFGPGIRATFAGKMLFFPYHGTVVKFGFCATRIFAKLEK